MIESFLHRLAVFTERRPWVVIAGSVVAAFCALNAFTVPVDLSFAGVMDRSNPEVNRYFVASAKYGLGGVVPILLEGPETRLDEALLDLQLALDDLEEVREVVLPLPRDWLKARAPFLVDRPVFDAWVALAEASPSIEGSRAIVSALEELAERRAPLVPEGERLVTVVLTHDTFELALDADDFPLVRQVVRETLEPIGITASFSGMPAIITQEREATLERLRWLGPASLVLVLGILLVVEKRLTVLASVTWPMVLSVGCTLALIGHVSGRLTLMESVFGVLVFGLGIDVAIHLLLRMREERGEGQDFETSLQRAMIGTGRGVVAGVATTAAAFMVLTLSPDPVFRRLGFAGGIGLVFCLAFLMIALPAQWRWIEHYRPSRGRERQLPGSAWLGAIARVCRRSPIASLAIGAVIVTLAGFEMSDVRYETNLERVFSRDIEAVDTARRIHDLFGVDPSPWLVAASDLDEARALTAAFESDPTFGRVESVALLITADAEERRSTVDALAPGLARRVRERELAAMSLTGPTADESRAAIAPLSLLLVAQSLGPPELDDLPEGLAERWVGVDGELLIYAFPAEPALDSSIAARERRAAQAIDPNATSMSVLYEALIGTDRPWLGPIMIAAAAVIALVVLLDFRSVRLSLLALLPVSASTVVTVGLLTWGGFSFNTITLVAIPILLGLGVDDGIHSVHRMLEPSSRSVEDAVRSVAPSIFLTTATTCASVGLLLLTRHPGIESVATLLLIGLPMSLIMTVTLLPAAASLFGGSALTRRMGE